jgi:hypothetical protein
MAIWDTDLKAGDGGHQLIAWAMERLAADPSINLFIGREYFNTATNRIRTYNGTTWDEYGTGSGGGDVTAASTTTFTNKTFDANGTGNSITNIETADLASGVLNTSTSLALASDTQIPSAAAVKAYADNLVVGLLDDRGNYDASVNTYPASGGSGAAGAIAKGDIWRVSVAGTLGTQAVQVGDSIRALQDAPGQTDANWAVMQNNDVQATTTVVGNTRYATNAEATAKTETSAAITPSNLTTYTQRFAASYGDATATTFTITHNLNTRDVTWTVWDTATNEARYPQVVATTVNSVTVSGYVTAPAANAFRIVIVG